MISFDGSACLNVGQKRLDKRNHAARIGVLGLIQQRAQFAREEVHVLLRHVLDRARAALAAGAGLCVGGGGWVEREKG